MATRRKKSPAPKLPELRIHKQSGRCYATFSGEVIWFGHKDDPSTRTCFDAHLAQWLGRGRKPEASPEEELTVAEMLALYLEHLEQRHAPAWHKRNGTRLTLAFKPLLELHAADLAREFTPRLLKGVRHALILSNRLCRSEVNARIGIVKKAFKWAASEELIPAKIHHGLSAIENLARGEYGVREGKLRGPADDAAVFETMAYLAPVPRALVELLWLTGARPSEIFNLCPVDVDRSGPVWTAELTAHKTSRKGKGRTLVFGPRAQEILRRYLDRVPRPAPEKPIFTPELAMREHLAETRANRKTPLWKSHEERLERERSRRKRREFSERFDSNALRKAIDRAIRRANEQRKADGVEEQLERWTPYQLRHAALTRIRNEKGLEAAKAIGGHASVLTSEGYTVAAERELARRVAGELG